MEVKVNVDVNVRLDDSAKGFLSGLISSLLDVVEARDAQPRPKIAPNTGASGASDSGGTVTEIYPTGPKDIPIDPDARITKPKTTKKKAKTKIEPKPVDEVVKTTPQETQAAPESPAPVSSGEGMDDTTFRQEVSKRYMAVSGEAKAHIAKALHDLLTRYGAANVSRVELDKREEFIKQFEFVISKLNG